MRGVSGKKHIANLIAFGDHCFKFPVADLQHLDIEIRQIEEFPQMWQDSLFVQQILLAGRESKMDNPIAVA